MTICSMPECQTTAGCLCRLSGIVSDASYIPPFAPSPADSYYSGLIAAKDAEITRLRAENEELREGSRIGDAVLSWMVKYDLLDAGNENRAEDVVCALNDLAPSNDDTARAEAFERGAQIAEWPGYGGRGKRIAALIRHEAATATAIRKASGEDKP